MTTINQLWNGAMAREAMLKTKYDISDFGASYQIIRTNLENGLQEIENHSARFISKRKCLKCPNEVDERQTVSGGCVKTIMEEISEQEKIETAVKDREKQILSWFDIPVKADVLGAMNCDKCGGVLFRIRGRFPRDVKRIVCPTCAVEILESIYSQLNLQSASISVQEKS